jgi:hypothetical protein
MIPSFKPGILSSNKIRAVGGGDVSCTTNFTEYVSYYSTFLETTQQTISGIDTTITLRYEQLLNDGGNIFYVKNGGSEVQLLPDDTFTVVNGDTLFFRWYPQNIYYVIQFEVINQSDSDINLGTITMENTF